MLLGIDSTKMLLILAVLPGILLAGYVYKLDKIEPEPGNLLAKLFIFGVLSTIPAAIIEGIAIAIVSGVCTEADMTYMVIENFLCVACVEEGCKYVLLKKASWKHPAFNFRFDGIVYAVFVGVGFAVFENIQYVMSYGIFTAVIRAITAVPAHTIFAIFMGHYYGEAKRQLDLGNEAASAALRKKAYLVPVLLHGFYDLAASVESDLFTLIFWVFLIALDIIAFKRVKKDSAEDMPA